MPSLWRFRLRRVKACRYPAASIRVSECNTVTRTLLLDLDGTLVNSVPDLAAALNRLLGARGLAPLSQDETAVMVGDGVAKLVERAFAARGSVPDPGAMAEYSADYSAHAAVETRPYRGVADALRSLAQEGWRLAVCTNKPETAARSVLAALGLAQYFAAIGGGDSFPVRKPDPAHLLATLQAAGGEPAHAVMAGDHANDVAAARGAGVPCIFAAWGYGPLAMAQGAVAVAQDFPDLVAIARRLLDGTQPPGCPR
jgi:phosphoglycolate phosphatase